MTTLSDEALMAYHDGQLTSEEATAVEAALAGDPEARERLRRFAKADALVGRAFGSPLHQPVPEALLRAIDAAPGPEQRSRPAGSKRTSGVFRPFRQWALPLAASVALVVGVAGGYGLSRMTPGGEADVAAATGLDRWVENVLETTASGASVALRSADPKGEIRVRPVLTFVDGGGRHCREYELSATGPRGDTATVGIACRGAGGGWRSEVTVAAKVQPTGAFLPASASSEAALEAAIDKLMVDNPLSLDRERVLIDRRWGSP
ncbi:MAG: hypothetical protein ACFCUO_03460 [Rhodospirillales bacterium]